MTVPVPGQPAGGLRGLYRLRSAGRQAAAAASQRARSADGGATCLPPRPTPSIGDTCARTGGMAAAIAL